MEGRRLKLAAKKQRILSLFLRIHLCSRFGQNVSEGVLLKEGADVPVELRRGGADKKPIRL